MPRKSKAQVAELRVPQVDNGEWTPGSFGWYIHQANVIASLNCEQNSIAAVYLARVVKAQNEKQVDAGAGSSRSAKVHAKRRSGRKVGR